MGSGKKNPVNVFFCFVFVLNLEHVIFKCTFCFSCVLGLSLYVFGTCWTFRHLGHFQIQIKSSFEPHVQRLHFISECRLCLWFQLSAGAYYNRPQMITQEPRALPPTWGTWAELAWPRCGCWEHLGSGQWVEDLSLFLSVCLSNKNKVKKIYICICISES